MLSDVACAEVSAMFKQCQNWAGKVRVPRAITPGTICQVAVTLSQVSVE